MEAAFEILRPNQLTVKVEKHCVEFCYEHYMRLTCEREVGVTLVQENHDK